MGAEEQLYCSTLSGLPAPSLTCLQAFPTQQIDWPVKTRVSCIILLFKTLHWLHISLRIKANIFITVYKFPWDLVTWHLSDFTAYLLTLFQPRCLSVISFTPISEPLNLLLSLPGTLFPHTSSMPAPSPSSGLYSNVILSVWLSLATFIKW